MTTKCLSLFCLALIEKAAASLQIASMSQASSVLITIVWFLGASVCAAVESEAHPSPPNVLFIAVDDLRLNLGCYGDPVAVTPNLDKLASKSTQFNRAYCQFASCNASRASVLTGQRPDSISVYRLDTNYRETAPDAITLPQHFRENGYHTESIGKILHNYGKSRDNDRAWSVPARLDKVSHFRDYALPENGDQKATVAEAAPINEGHDPYVDATITTDAIETLGRLAASDQPFFLAVGFMKPHSPYNAPQKYWDLYEREEILPLCADERADGISDLNWPSAGEIRGFADVPKSGPIPAETQARMRHGYYATTSYLDANIGKVLDALEASGVAENTIILFWSDHGYHLGENDHWAKVTVRELDAHVPLLVHAPGHEPATTDAIVEYIDIFPTLSELSGLPAPQGIDGKSFVPVMTGASDSFRPAALTQTCRPWNRKGPVKQMGYSIRTADHRYTQWVDHETQAIIAEEIYDLGSDLYQRTNQIDNPDFQDIIATHRRLLEEERGLHD
ncbi:MAG: sulfatase [Verrucomicrobiota bacterium]